MAGGSGLVSRTKIAYSDFILVFFHTKIYIIVNLVDNTTYLSHIIKHLKQFYTKSRTQETNS